MNIYSVLIAPMVTEQSGRMEKQGKYVFKVAAGSTKGQIAAAVERTFKVNVASVNTINVSGKVKNFRGKPAKRPDWKKAVVTLRGDQSITIFEGN